MFSTKAITNAFCLYWFCVFCIVNHNIIVLKTIFIWFFPISECYCNLLRMWAFRIFANWIYFLFRILLEFQKKLHTKPPATNQFEMKSQKLSDQNHLRMKLRNRNKYLDSFGLTVTARSIENCSHIMGSIYE